MVDINAIPLVMVERMEVLTDGGSALYGSDAVAGVVNMIMRTEFEGLELYADIQNVEKAGSLFDKTGSGIWG
jgi:outer membrane receptor protein involved in Fe transport